MRILLFALLLLPLTALPSESWKKRGTAYRGTHFGPYTEAQRETADQLTRLGNSHTKVVRSTSELVELALERDPRLRNVIQIDGFTTEGIEPSMDTLLSRLVSEAGPHTLFITNGRLEGVGAIYRQLTFDERRHSPYQVAAIADEGTLGREELAPLGKEAINDFLLIPDSQVEILMGKSAARAVIDFAQLKPSLRISRVILGGNVSVLESVAQTLALMHVELDGAERARLHAPRIEIALGGEFHATKAPVSGFEASEDLRAYLSIHPEVIPETAAVLGTDPFSIARMRVREGDTTPRTTALARVSTHIETAMRWVQFQAENHLTDMNRSALSKIRAQGGRISKGYLDSSMRHLGPPNRFEGRLNRLKEVLDRIADARDAARLGGARDGKMSLGEPRVP